jgi:hypothetical protein
MELDPNTYGQEALDGYGLILCHRYSPQSSKSHSYHWWQYRVFVPQPCEPKKSRRTVDETFHVKPQAAARRASAVAGRVKKESREERSSPVRGKKDGAF